MYLIDGKKLLEEIKNMDLGYMQHREVVQCIADAISKQYNATKKSLDSKSNFLSKEEIINYLEENRACESDLAEITGGDNKYFTIYPNTDPTLDSEYIGYTFVKCSEGFLSLPIESFDFHNGFEQYDLFEAKIVEKNIVEQYYKEFKKQSEFFRYLVSE